MPYAVNVADLSLDGVAFRAQLLLSPDVVPTRRIVKCGPNLDDGAVVLECDDQRAEAICEVLNTERPVRCYVQGARGGWSRLKLEARKGARKKTKQ
jgi:hypothetical protein